MTPLPDKRYYHVKELSEALADELGISPWAAKKRLYYAVKTHRVESVRICGSIRIRKEAAKRLLGEDG